MTKLAFRSIYVFCILFVSCSSENKLFDMIHYKVVELETGSYYNYKISNEHLSIEYCNFDISSNFELSCKEIFSTELKNSSQLSNLIHRIGDNQNFIEPSIDGWEESVQVFKRGRLIKQVLMVNSTNSHVDYLIDFINSKIPESDLKIIIR